MHLKIKQSILLYFLLLDNKRILV